MDPGGAGCPPCYVWRGPTSKFGLLQAQFSQSGTVVIAFRRGRRRSRTESFTATVFFAAKTYFCRAMDMRWCLTLWRELLVSSLLRAPLLRCQAGEISDTLTTGFIGSTAPSNICPYLLTLLFAGSRSSSISIPAHNRTHRGCLRDSRSTRGIFRGADSSVRSTLRGSSSTVVTCDSNYNRRMAAAWG